MSFVSTNGPVTLLNLRVGSPNLLMSGRGRHREGISQMPSEWQEGSGSHDNLYWMMLRASRCLISFLRMRLQVGVLRLVLSAGSGMKCLHQFQPSHL